MNKTNKRAITSALILNIVVFALLFSFMKDGDHALLAMAMTYASASLMMLVLSSTALHSSPAFIAILIVIFGSLPFLIITIIVRAAGIENYMAVFLAAEVVAMVTGGLAEALRATFC